MQENEFEKQVRNLMDDLRIEPSEPVWNYVEKRIPESNRRRRFMAFILLCAGVAVCGYFFYQKFYSGNYADTVNSLQESSIAAKSSNDEKSTTKDSLINTTDALIKKDNNNTVSDKEKNTLPVNENKQINDDVKSNTKNAITNKTIATLQKNNNDFSIGEKVNKLSTTNKSTATDKKISEKENNSYSLIIPGIDNISFDGDKKSTILNAAKPAELIEEKTHETTDLKKETIHDSINKNILTIVDTATVSAEKKKQPKDIKKITIVNKKLQWGATTFYGISDIIEGINLSGLGGRDKSYVSSDFITGFPSASRFDSIVYATQAKNIKARQAFSLGVTVRKNISKRTSITTGIEFTRINTQIQTGNIKDSNVMFYYNNSQTLSRLNNFYDPGVSLSRINSYNFIQIPLMFNYQINKSKKLPLTINAGMSLSGLISSNALVYDSYNQAYYKNTDLLHKTQVQLLGGFNMQFALRNKSNIVVGPQFQYGLTGVVKNSNSNQHFFTWGLRASYYLKSK